MNTQRAYNKKREKLNMLGNKSARRKKYKDIIKEMGARNITLDNISKGEKIPGMIDLMESTGMTMDEFVVLGQYSKAILDRDTRASEFLRDSAGEKPSNVIDINSDDNGLSKMSLEELQAMRAELQQVLELEKKEK